MPHAIHTVARNVTFPALWSRIPLQKNALRHGTPDASISLDLVALGVGTGEIVMRYFMGLVCVLALGVMPLIGCGETNGDGGEGGMRIPLDLGTRSGVI